MPRTVRAVVQVLNAMGVQHFEPSVVPQLLEFSQRTWWWWWTPSLNLNLNLPSFPSH